MPTRLDPATMLRLDVATAQPLVLAARLDRSLVANLTGVLALGDRIATTSDLVDRAGLDVPVAPTGTVDASTVFEDAGNPARRLYLPTYTLRYDSMRFARTATGFEVSAVLDVGGPPAPGTEPFLVAPTAALTFSVGGSPVQQSLTFSDYVPAEGGLRVRCTGTDPELRAHVLWALQHAEARTRLTISRTVTAAVAVQVKQDPGTTPPTWNPPTAEVQLVATAPPVVLEARLDGGALRSVRALDPNLRMATLVRREVIDEDGPIVRDHRLPRDDGDGGPIVRDHRDPPGPQPDPQPDPVFVTRYRKVITPITTQAYHDGDQPLFYDPQVDPVQLVPHVVGGHTYLRQSASSPVFYQLPDELRLVRLPTGPRTPVMSLSFAAPTGGGTAGEIPATLRFAVVPWTDPDRVAAARAALAKIAPPPYPDGVTGVSVVPLDLESKRLTLTLRPGGSASSAAVAVDAPEVSLTRPFECSITLPTPAFQPAWAALRTAAGGLFTGTMEIRLDDTGTARRLPFDGRIDRALAPSGLLDAVDVTPVGDGTLRARLVNAVESPVRLTAPTARVVVPGPAGTGPDGVSVVADIVPVAGAFPVELPAGAGLDVVLRPRTPLPADAGAPEAVVDGGLLPLVDPDALYDAILDRTVTPLLSRTLPVRALAGVFGDDPTLLVLQVVVDGGDGVEVARPADPRPAFEQVAAGRPVVARLPIKTYLLSGTGELPSDVTYRLRGVRPGPKDAWSDPVTEVVLDDGILVTEYRRPG